LKLIPVFVVTAAEGIFFEGENMLENMNSHLKKVCV
jgi:hypothetical protein